MNVIPVTLAAGAGSRLWPVSGKRQRKPFIRLAGSPRLRETYPPQATGHERVKLTPKRFLKLHEDSSDSAAMHHSRHLTGLSCRTACNDIYACTRLAGLLPQDQCHNRVACNTILHDVRGSANPEQNRSEPSHTNGAPTRRKNRRHFTIRSIDVKPADTLSLRMHHSSWHWIAAYGIAHHLRGDKESAIPSHKSNYVAPRTTHQGISPLAHEPLACRVKAENSLGTSRYRAS